MSPELISILTVGVALAALMLTSLRSLRQNFREDIKQLEALLRGDIGELRQDLKSLEQRVGRLEHGQAKLEGLLEGLREAMFARKPA